MSLDSWYKIGEGFEERMLLDRVWNYAVETGDEELKSIVADLEAKTRGA